MDVKETRGWQQAGLDPTSLFPLRRLQRLRCLQLAQALTVDGFFFLCALPLTTLHLRCSWLNAPPAPLVLPELTVASTWREVHFPSPPPWISSYLSVCSEALSRYAEGTKAAAHAGAAVQPALRHVIGGCDISGRCMQVIVRIPSLTKLQPRDLDLVDGAAPDPSPLFTSDLQPLLPQLHSFRFPRWYGHRLREKARARSSTRPLPSSPPTPPSFTTST